MRKTGSKKRKKLTDSEIDLFCRSVEEILRKINDRCDPHKGEETAKEEALTHAD